MPNSSACGLCIWILSKRLLWDRVSEINRQFVFTRAAGITQHILPPNTTPKDSPPLTMEDTHPLSIDSHVNLASRATVAQADAFMKPFNLSINVVKSASEDGESARVGYFHRSTRRWYYATASLAEMNGDPSRDWLQQLTDLFPWATLEGEEELSGRLLGTSGRVDGLQGCDVGRVVDVKSGQFPMVDDLAVVL